MTIGSVDSGSYPLTLDPLTGGLQTGSVQQSAQNDGDADDAPASASGASGSPAQVHISKRGELFSRLQQLAQQDPAKFKQVAADIADKLKSAAQNESGQSASFLSDVAARFQNAADSGDPAALEPNRNQQSGNQPYANGAAAHHAHHHHGAPDANVQQVFSDILQEVNQATGNSA